MKRENYDANGNVCDNQDDFNQAFRAAIKYNNQQNMKQAGAWTYVIVAIWAILFVWAIILAMKVQDQTERTLHLLFAVVASPAYVLAYLLSMLASGKGGVSMGMCGAKHY